jgi:hypothetical protein
MTRVAPLVLAAALLAGCGATTTAQPKDDPGVFATKVVDLIVHNKYSTVWGDLHSVDKRVTPSSEYVDCETRNPVIAVPRSMKVLSVKDESVGIGDGTFVDSKAVAVRLGFAGSFKVTHTVHVVADHGKWTWILPAWRYRDYKGDTCPTGAGSAPPPVQS